MENLMEYIPYIQEYSRHYSTVGICCDKCGEISEHYCSEVFKERDYLFDCPICGYNDWIAVIPIAKQIKNELIRAGFNFNKLI